MLLLSLLSLCAGLTFHWFNYVKEEGRERLYMAYVCAGGRERRRGREGRRGRGAFRHFGAPLMRCVHCVYVASVYSHAGQ
ncbi:unnamed protein product [Thelazia callipaeda]|uniref:Secreted protein n=1 Tax=Thelazia callipaeda TaxID=103827 RepID=A0A0N5D8E2_THECL|nr:unnamed protein product [Thelazia callipaeda]